MGLPAGGGSGAGAGWGLLGQATSRDLCPRGLLPGRSRQLSVRSTNPFCKTQPAPCVHMSPSLLPLSPSLSPPTRPSQLSSLSSAPSLTHSYLVSGLSLHPDSVPALPALGWIAVSDMVSPHQLCRPLHSAHHSPPLPLPPPPAGGSRHSRQGSQAHTRAVSFVVGHEKPR